MARYIKANPKVVDYLNLRDYRNKLRDGNYLLWQRDMTAFGPLPNLADTLTRIGAIALLPHEAREEQDGTNLRPLPTATDPNFVVETVATSTEETPAEETPAEETPAEETPAEETPESNDETEDNNTNEEEE